VITEGPPFSSGLEQYHKPRSEPPIGVPFRVGHPLSFCTPLFPPCRLIFDDRPLSRIPPETFPRYFFASSFRYVKRKEVPREISSYFHVMEQMVVSFPLPGVSHFDTVNRLWRPKGGFPLSDFWVPDPTWNALFPPPPPSFSQQGPCLGRFSPAWQSS